MIENQLSQKIVSLAVDGMERFYAGLSDEKNPVDRIVKENMDKASGPVREFVQKRLSMVRALPVSRQKEMMGKYYNRHIEIKPVISEKFRMSAIPATYKVYKRPLFTALEPAIVEKLMGWLDWLKEKEEDRFYKHVSLELDKIVVIDEDDWGRAEIVIIGGASDGTGQLTHGLITQEKSAGERETRHYHGSDRVAVPKWPLADDGSSKISFYCQVWELDEHDRDEIVSFVGGAAGIATGIISGLVAGGIIGGPAGAIAGAIVGAIAGLISLFVSLNKDDYWGGHQIQLWGPFEKPTTSPARFVHERRPDGEHYKLHFLRHLYE